MVIRLKCSSFDDGAIVLESKSSSTKLFHKPDNVCSVRVQNVVVKSFYCFLLCLNIILSSTKVPRSTISKKFLKQQKKGENFEYGNVLTMMLKLRDLRMPQWEDFSVHNSATQDASSFATL
jgi:hypothetical protein